MRVLPFAVAKIPIPRPRRSSRGTLPDKLQVLVLSRPAAARVVELYIDRLLLDVAPPPAA